jgi:hypothetical protein
MSQANMLKFLRRLPLLALALLALLLQGCWTLDHYIARVRIEADGSYKYYAEGVAVHSATAFAMRNAAYQAKTDKAPAGGAKAGEPKPDAHKPEGASQVKAVPDVGLSKDLALARKDPRVQDLVDIGGGRVRFVLSGKANINGGEIIYMEREKPLSYAQGPNGTLSVRLKDAVVGRNAEALGLKPVGDVTITLAEGIQVLEHNADRTPTGPGGSYRWHIEKPGQPAPHLVLRLPKQ